MRLCEVPLSGYRRRHGSGDKWRHISFSGVCKFQSTDNNDCDAWTTSYWTNLTVVSEQPTRLFSPVRHGLSDCDVFCTALKPSERLFGRSRSLLLYICLCVYTVEIGLCGSITFYYILVVLDLLLPVTLFCRI